MSRRQIARKPSSTRGEASRVGAVAAERLEQRVDVMLLHFETQGQRRIDRSRTPDRPHAVARPSARSARRENRDRRAAMRARRCIGEIDWCAAVRAVDHLDVRAQLGELRRRQRTHEILLTQEIEEGREPAVLSRASPVRERRVALAIVGEQQSEIPRWACERLPQRQRRHWLAIADEAKQLQRRSRREWRANESARVSGQGDDESSADSPATIFTRNAPLANGRRVGNRSTIEDLQGRGVAQPGSAPALGAGGRGFESRRPDHFPSSGVPAGFHLSRDVERHAAASRFRTPSSTVGFFEIRQLVSQCRPQRLLPPADSY